MTFVSTENFYEVRNSEIVKGPYPRSQTGFGENTSDNTLAIYGHYRLWVDDGGAKPGQYYQLQTGQVLVDEVTQPPRCTRTDIWVKYSPEQQRAEMLSEIDAQVVQDPSRRIIEDPTLWRSTERTSGAASAKASDLEDTPDANLDAFDTKIDPTPVDGAGFIEARMTATIGIGSTPWPNDQSPDILALIVVLEIIMDGDVAAGASARAHMFGPNDGPSGAVMTFSQDAANPAIWTSETQVGRYWQDPAETASMRLLWNNGSLPVAETKILQGQGDSQSAVVRAPI